MRTSTSETYQERILNVLVYIQDHLDEDLRLEDLAERAFFSPFHFHRIFTGLVGESVKDHVRRLRMERAAFRLIHTSDRITDIAFDAGYESLEAFSRRFRIVFGESPSNFRRRHADAWRLPAPVAVHWNEEFASSSLNLGSESLPDLPIIEVPDRTIAFARHLGPYDEAVEVWTAMKNALSATQAAPFGICYDDPGITPASKLRYDACVEVPDDYRPGAGQHKRILEGGSFALYTHHGSYEALVNLYEWLIGRWAPSDEIELRDTPCLEVYRRSVIDGRNPDECVTDILIPVTAPVPA